MILSTHTYPVGRVGRIVMNFLSFSRCGTDVGLGTLGLVETQDRSTSPVSSSMFESGSPDDLLLMFEGEESEVLRDESGLPLQEGEGSELYEKLGSIQKALQEANQEMDSYMSTLSEISQRHFCSPIHSKFSSKQNSIPVFFFGFEI